MDQGLMKMESISSPPIQILQVVDVQLFPVRTICRDKVKKQKGKGKASQNLFTNEVVAEIHALRLTREN
ncbi:hypothetical protein ACS0TY_006446 [Phlomoides rotata]